MNQRASIGLFGGLGCLGCLGFMAVYAAIGALFALIIEWAWNLLVPLFFHGPHIGYAVACAIFVVISLLFALFL